MSMETIKIDMDSDVSLVCAISSMTGYICEQLIRNGMTLDQVKELRLSGSWYDLGVPCAKYIVAKLLDDPDHQFTEHDAVAITGKWVDYRHELKEKGKI